MLCDGRKGVEEEGGGISEEGESGGRRGGREGGGEEGESRLKLFAYQRQSSFGQGEGGGEKLGNRWTHKNRTTVFRFDLKSICNS